MRTIHPIGSVDGFSLGQRVRLSTSDGRVEEFVIASIEANRLDLKPARRALTAAQILAVAGTISAVIGTVGGALRSPLIIGVASFVMLLGNIGAFLADRNKSR